MKTLKITTEARAYSEEEAKDYIEQFRLDASSKGYTVGAAGYTYKTKKAKGEIVDEAWICKCVANINDIWDADVASN